MAVGPILDNPATRLQTTSATITTAITIPTATNRGYQVWVQAIGFEKAGALGGGYIRCGTFTNDAGTVNQVGTTTDIATHEDDVDWEVSISISGTNILVRVQGDASQTVEWGVSARVLEIDE